MFGLPNAFHRIRFLSIVAVGMTISIAGVGSGQKPAESPAVEGLLLLRNGSVIEGAIRKVPGGYAARVPYGEISVPESQVDAFCTTLEEAYEHRRNRLPAGDMKAHVELALWCLRYHLLPQAEAEIEAAAALSPQHPMLPLLRRRLELLRESPEGPQQSPNQSVARSSPPSRTDPSVRPAHYQLPTEPASRGELPSSPPGKSTPPSTRPKPVPADASLAASELPSRAEGPPLNSSRSSRPLMSFPGDAGDWFGDRASSGGGRSAQIRARQRQVSQVVRAMPPGAVLRFTQTIQPIVTQYCATAQCHGGPQAQEFRWLRPPGGMLPNSQTTQENLFAFLQQIDWEDPASSPVLRMPLQPHGGLPTPVFAGPHAPQYRELLDWVFWVTAGGGGASPVPPPETSTRPPESTAAASTQERPVTSLTPGRPNYRQSAEPIEDSPGGPSQRGGTSQHYNPNEFGPLEARSAFAGRQEGELQPAGGYPPPGAPRSPLAGYPDKNLVAPDTEAQEQLRPKRTVWEGESKPQAVPEPSEWSAVQSSGHLRLQVEESPAPQQQAPLVPSPDEGAALTPRLGGNMPHSRANSMELGGQPGGRRWEVPTSHSPAVSQAPAAGGDIHDGTPSPSSAREATPPGPPSSDSETPTKGLLRFLPWKLRLSELVR